LLVAVGALSTCSRRETANPVPEGAGRVPGLAAPLADAPSVEGSTVEGSVAGREFGAVASALLIESPECSRATVVYLFSKPVRCLDLSFAGWDQAMDPAAAVLELHVEGRTAGSYLVVDAPSPTAGEAVVRSVSAPKRGTAGEASATGGWITMEKVAPSGATGTFAVTFGARQVKGRFEAAFCPSGHEP
jgi:hypothetical protein